MAGRSRNADDLRAEIRELGEDFDAGHVEATYEHGMLRIVLPLAGGQGG